MKCYCLRRPVVLNNDGAALQWPSRLINSVNVFLLLKSDFVGVVGKYVVGVADRNVLGVAKLRTLGTLIVNLNL